jgi:hypothetical protein
MICRTCGAARTALREPIETGYRLQRLVLVARISKAPQTMAPDDIPVEHPASETQRKPMGQLYIARRSIGPESEVRGGPETPDSAVDAGRRQPADESRKNNPMRTAARDPARNDGKHSVAGAAAPSDPPKPPGVPPEVPEPDKPTPIEEPPRPIPVPPDNPPPPIVAASRRASGRSSP